MPHITNGQIDSSLQQQALSLLQLLLQLSDPESGLLVALPNGQVLAYSEQVNNFLPTTAESNTPLTLASILKSETKEDYTWFVEELQDKKKLKGYMPAPASKGFSYTCKLLQYQNETFVVVELTQVQHHYVDESYHNVFENSTEALFILDQEGNFIDVNHTALGLIEQQKPKLIGKSIFRNFDLTLFERVALKGQLQQAMAGAVQKFEWWLHEKNQDLLPVEITLQKGFFNNTEVIFGSARNLYEIIGNEQNVRFRNHQLEFVNNLITNLSTSGSQQDILKYTLDELLDKSDIVGGSVYTYTTGDGKASLAYSAGETSGTLLPTEIAIASNLAQLLLTIDRRRALADICDVFEKKVSRQLTTLPITTEQDVKAFIILWPERKSKISQSFLSLLDFIGNALGNYIARHELLLQLSTTQDKYKLLFEASYDAILLFKDGVVVECNEKALQFFRCKREDLIGHSPTDFSPEFQPDGMRSDVKTAQLVERVLETGESFTFEWRNRRKDGTLFDSEININRLLIDGKYHIQAFKRDVTQRKLIQSAKRREEVVQESMEQFRNFMDKVNLIYYSLDTKGRVVYCNNYFLKYIEYSQEEVLGKNYFDLLVPSQDREQRRQDFIRLLESKHVNSHYERDILTKTGQTRTLRWNTMFDYGPLGELKGITNVGKDMTDKRIAMEALKDNKIRLQDLFDNGHDLIMNISVDNKFIFVNRAWKERLGYTDEDIESLTLNDIVHPYYKAKLIYQLRNLYKGENVNKIETVFLTKAGKPVHLIGSINCSWQDGQPVATRVILHDITDRIKAERLQKVYYSIANLAISSKDLNSLYSAIHRELSKIIETRNIYIALCDREHNFLHFVYLVDQFIDKTSRTQIRRQFSAGLSEYIIKTGKPLYMQKRELKELAKSENFVINGAIPEVILCSPLAIGDRIIGVITLQDYQNPDAYVHTDIEILHFISNQVALAIERKLNEEQINNQNARLNAIFESGTHHMWSINRNYELTSFNRNFSNTFVRRTGQPLEIYNKLDDTSLISAHEFSFDFWKEKYEKAFAGNPQHFEVHFEGTDGWREVYLNPIYLEDGSFEEISGIALDITDKKKSQLDLAESEEKFRHIFESFQDVYYRSSVKGVVELASPSVYNLLGYTEEEITGLQTSKLYVSPEDREHLVNKVFEEGSIRDYELKMVCKDGSHKTVIIDSQIVNDTEGTPVALEGVIRDVSELKRTQKALLQAKEEAENLLKVKTQFLANMSHELRTPMNGIIGMIDLLSQINTDEEQREYIDTLRKSSDALLAILNDILDLSKMQAGKLAINEGGIDLHDTLGKIHSLFANRAQQKDLTFTYTITPDTPRYISTDETRLLQVLSNLTSNAIKFTNAGEVSIWVHGEQLKNTEEYLLHVRVKDSGIGITPEDQQLLFNDFTQLDNSSTKTFGGTGLGLAISKQLTSLLGGDIGVESNSGSGSTFWFNIRVKQADARKVEEQLQRENLQKTEIEVLEGNPYVLLVDDNQINQKVAQKQLERLGCRIDIASNGLEAIDYAVSHNYSIIFMDIQMPEMDGVTATKHIKEKLQQKCPPIVAMTAYSMREDADRFISQGMDDYVSKPIKGIDLHTVITKWQLERGIAEVVLEEQEAEATADIEIIDTNVVEQLKQIGGDDFTKQLYEEFEQEAAELLEEAKKELEAQHYKSILSTLHQLKGTGFTLGINIMAELAKTLEHDIKSDKLENIDKTFSKLLDEYEHYRKAYKEIII
ncbi:PAS domain S-box protein [Pontibacter harenae]|uniref:PAS domain S-box protein n=1 Tax=Pontibacter harenae TaxID=2894083 RepID=UPI001E64C1FC|nr:PAS domain S-box protein [Pontibacter harenae]MCC9165768.1 PAS domain S-box protein [Pontibacter harenae]